MDFIVDRVSEDSFYENVLIGLPKVLENLPSISEPYLERYSPVQHNIICTWEQKYGVLLPEDLRSFYASSNGLLYCYNFYYTEEETEQNVIVGKIKVNCLNDLVQIYGYDIKSDHGVNVDGERYELRLGADSRVFELVNLNDMGRVVLVYINPRYLPTIWLQTNAMKFYFLADDFTTYLRMCIHHLGIPFWQFAFTFDGIPEWSEMVFRLLSPATLPLDRNIEEMRRNSEKKFDEELSDIPINKIDSNIFRTIPKVSTQITSVSATEQTENGVKKKQGKSKFPTKFQRKPLYQKK